MKRTFKTKKINNRNYNILALPGTNFFKFEIVNMYGSIVERIYKARTGRNVYGLSHLVEHLSFRATKDYSSKELLSLINSEGTYNASTDTTRINYWFQTTMEKSSLGIKLVLNYALNDLTRISQEEFDIEKKVVYNEAKRYADDDQTMFTLNIYPTINELNPEDNIIGIPETIETFTLEDAIALKSIFLQNQEVHYNITYDPMILTENEIIEQIEFELNRFKHEPNIEGISRETYYSYIKTIHNKNHIITNESNQMLTSINLDVVDNIIIANAGNDYLARYAKDTSLNDVIREQHGLTYGIDLYTRNIDYQDYVQFSCDVSKGSEELMMKLFEQSVNDSIDNWSEESYNKYMNTRRLKRTLNLLNQKNYEFWINLNVWNHDIFEELKDIASEDLDKGYEELDKIFCTEEKIKNYLENFRFSVNLGRYSLVTNY
jgi:hypothetical protein